MGGNQNPMMYLGQPGQQMMQPIRGITPGDLSTPQEHYAYNQMMAYLSGANKPQQGLDPRVLAWQQALMQQYFPGIKRY